MIITPGKEIRFSKLFSSEYQKAIIVALDHGGGGVYKGLENFEMILKKIVAAKPDAVMLNLGMLRKFSNLFQGKNAPAIIASLDINGEEDTMPEILSVDPQGVKIGTVKEALRLGADAVKLLITWGRNSETFQNRTIEWAGEVVQECSYWNVPLIIEPCLWGRRVPIDLQKDPKLMADICRISAEIGADMLKVDYTGDKESYKKLIDSSVVPVLILGGRKRSSAQDFISFVVDGINAGAAGIVSGRSVYQTLDIDKMLDALREAVYRKDAKKAIQMIEGIY